MSEERTPYLTSPFDQPAAPGVAEEYRRARGDFTQQVNRAATAEENARRLEAKLQEVQQAAWDLCRTAQEMPKLTTQTHDDGSTDFVAVIKNNLTQHKLSKLQNDYTAALHHLAHLIGYPGWYQL